MGKKAAGEAGEGAGLDKALGFAGVGMDLFSLGMSLSESGKQAAAQREAQRQAEISTKMQIQQQQQNFFEAMRVPTEAYDRALREGTAQQAQAIGALQEGDTRQLLGAIGKVNAVGVDQIAGLTDEMAQQMFELQKLQAQEKMLNADDLAKIYEERTKGAQLAAAAAEKAKFGLINNAFRAGKDALIGADKLRKEYRKGKDKGGQGGQGSMPSYYAGNEPFGISTNPGGQSPSTQGSSMFGPQQSIFSSVSTPDTQQTDWSQDPNNWKVNPFG
jgi:hypothetical protein